MSGLNNNAIVQKQYQSANNLQIRIALHQKYSVNKQPFSDWIFEQYMLRENDRILEVGCGDGSMWCDADKKLPRGVRLLLTDFSEGMLDAAKQNAVGEKVCFAQADIQHLPYADGSFDIVIANMMLYHVPDIHKGISEVKRVLKQGGIFYCATYGENGITDYLQELLSDYGVQKDMNKNFTLQNGESMLRQHFDHVEKRDRADGLEVTDVEDLLDYIFSMTAMMSAVDVDRDELKEVLLTRMENGVIHIPKEYGMFISVK